VLVHHDGGSKEVITVSSHKARQSPIHGPAATVIGGSSRTVTRRQLWCHDRFAASSAVAWADRRLHAHVEAARRAMLDRVANPD